MRNDTKQELRGKSRAKSGLGMSSSAEIGGIPENNGRGSRLSVQSSAGRLRGSGSRLSAGTRASTSPGFESYERLRRLQLAEDVVSTEQHLVLAAQRLWGGTRKARLDGLGPRSQSDEQRLSDQESDADASSELAGILLTSGSKGSACPGGELGEGMSRTPLLDDRSPLYASRRLATKPEQVVKGGVAAGSRLSLTDNEALHGQTGSIHV